MQQIGFHCRTYCSLNVFRAPLCPPSGAQDFYRWLLPMVLSALVYRSLVWCGVELWVMCPVCGMFFRETSRKPELLMMGIMVPETCWANNKFCNNNQSVASSWHFISTYTSIQLYHITNQLLVSYRDLSSSRIFRSVVVIPYWRFGTTYRSHLQESRYAG